jgi:hypothetical protein
MAKYTEVMEAILSINFATQHMTDKECGLFLKNYPDERVKKLLFPYRKGWAENPHPKYMAWRKMAFSMFYPKSNNLPGYQPSSAMHRFSTIPDDVMCVSRVTIPKPKRS